MALASDHQQLQQRRSKKSKNGQKKQPQRGLGVAQLERLRIEEESKKVMLASSSFVPGSCFQGHGRVSALCLSSPPLHLHPHLAAQTQSSLRNSINVPLVSLGASARQAPQSHYKDPNLGNISQHSSIHQLDQSLGLLGKIQAAATADSSSCKSGISSDASAAAVAASHHLFRTGRSSSSPSPCSSSQHNGGKPDHILDEGGDEASKVASPPFLFLPSSSSCSSETKSSKNATMMSAFRQLIQSGSSSSNIKITPDASESFDPSFRRARRLRGDCRDWPGIPFPAIKELSSFQIPGNTIPAVSSANRTCFTGVRDGATDRVSGYSVSVDKGSSSVKLVASSSSPTSLSAASSLARSEVCFAFEQQLKDSCSSSLKNTEATSSTKAACDFLTLGLSSPEACSEIHKRPNRCQSHCGLSDSKSAADDDESSKFVVTPQEASGETEDHWKFLAPTRKSIKLQQSSSPSESPFTLELSLKVPSIEDSSLELKLAL